MLGWRSRGVLTAVLGTLAVTPDAVLLRSIQAEVSQLGLEVWS